MDFVIFFIIFWIGSKIMDKFGIKINPARLISITLAIFGLIILIIAYVLYSLPSHSYTQGSGMSIIPTVIGVVTLLCATFMIISKRDNIIDSTIRNLPFYSWALYAVAVGIIVISKYGFLLSIYSPAIFKSDVQIPHVGVEIFIVGYFVAALTLYFFSRVSYAKSPNVTFQLSYVTVIYCFYQVTVYALTLIFGLIVEYNISYPFLASIVVLGYLPLVLVFFIMYGLKPKQTKIV